MSISIFDSNNIFVCKAKCREMEEGPTFLVIEDAQVPITLVGKEVTVIFENANELQPAIKGKLFAWGEGCVDRETDKLKVVAIAG